MPIATIDEFQSGLEGPGMPQLHSNVTAAFPEATLTRKEETFTVRTVRPPKLPDLEMLILKDFEHDFVGPPYRFFEIERAEYIILKQKSTGLHLHAFILLLSVHVTCAYNEL